MLNIPQYRHVSVSFKNSPNRKEDYNDPLLKWPVRGLAYSNELGAALSEIAPKLGTLLWFPAMLYFGADFYDKYKNEKTQYNPNVQRGTQQVIFQTLASVILPTAAVITGQKTASALGVFGKDGLSLQSQEEITNFLQKFASRRHLDKYTNDIQDFKKQFEESLVTKRGKLIRKTKIANPFQLIGKALFNKNHPESLAMSQKEKVLKYADKNIDSMFSIYEQLMQNKKPKEFSDKMWKRFEKLKNEYLKDPDYKNTYMRDAAEDIIFKYQKSQIRNAKLLKTLGGFVALGLAIKPIDLFVENVIIKKYVEPKLTYVFENKQKIPKSLQLEN